MGYSQPAASLEYVHVRVRDAISGADPTGDTVKMAFMPGPAYATPQSSDWKAASWTTDLTQTPHAFYARCLVGPGGTTTLAAGTYRLWVQLTDTPEIPARPVGDITIT